MKISSAAVNALTNAEKAKEMPILPLVPEPVKYAKEDILTYKLRTDPADAASATYEMRIPVCKADRDLRSAIIARSNLRKVWIGLALDADPAGADRIAQQVYKSQALTNYNAGRDLSLQHRNTVAKDNARQQGKIQVAPAGGVGAPALETDDQFEARINGIVTALSMDDLNQGCLRVIGFMTPTRGLARVKRYLRRKCRKPVDMKVKEFFIHLFRINSEELPFMPPAFSANQALSEDELIDILLYAFPSSWQTEMQRQGFDPYAMGSTPTQVVNFCERFEAAEELENKGNKVSSKNGKKTSGNKSQKTSSNNNGSYYCMHHGQNNTHNTDQCMVLKKMLSSMNEGSSKGKSKNKTWSRKAEKAKSDTKKELAAFVRKTMRNELNAMQKKRKAEDSDSDEEEVQAFDELDLSNFDYSDMSNLKIASDDDEDDVKMTAETNEDDDDISV